MGLDAIVSAIASEAAAQVEATRHDAQRRADELLLAARARASTEQDRWTASRDDEAERAAARIVNRARLEADRSMAQAREQLFGEALERLRAKLDAMVTGPEYERILRALYEEDLTIVPEADATVLVRAADQELMELIVSENHPDTRVQGTLNCVGGVDIEASDGRAVRNTLDARLFRSERELRHLAVKVVPEFADVGASP